MRQRLGIAAAMIGDPRVLILDEPANGLDPEGIRWMREFLRAFASQGRTVFVSSHLLGEMEQLADDLIIIAAGRLVAQGPVAEIVGGMSQPGPVRVRTPHADQLVLELTKQGARVDYPPDGALLSAVSTRPRSVERRWLHRRSCMSWSPRSPTWSRCSWSSRTRRQGIR
jgi:ABC-2 type transport system ATP-binding protein